MSGRALEGSAGSAGGLATALTVRVSSLSPRLMLGLLLGWALFVTGTRLAMTAGWRRLVPGLFAQAGLAEEVLFRGYLFRHLRGGRSFVRAAWAAAGPFAAVHLVLL